MWDGAGSSSLGTIREVTLGDYIKKVNEEEQLKPIMFSLDELKLLNVAVEAWFHSKWPAVPGWLPMCKLSDFLEIKIKMMENKCV